LLVELCFTPLAFKLIFPLKIDFLSPGFGRRQSSMRRKDDHMSKTDAAAIQKRTERQVANTSGGGHLGGTNFGQGNDAKTSGGSAQGGKGRPSGGGSKR
jgi:hypothetical protein